MSAISAAEQRAILDLAREAAEEMAMVDRSIIELAEMSRRDE